MKKLFYLFSIFLSVISYAQKGGIKGYVLDETKQPLLGATIVISENNAGTSTDFNGYFQLLNIKNGTYTIVVSFMGYERVSKKINIKNGITEQLFKLIPSRNKLKEVTIQGSLAKEQAKALNKQKNNDNITNVISSNQVNKFPDTNIGDALKRVSGIAMQNDQGEARDIIIRGLAPQLNSVTLNGDRIPSAEGDNRRVQMDLIPSDMVQTIEVSKAVTPDMEGDAIGGSVNLVTRSAPANFKASITSSYGMNPVRNGSNYTVSGLIADRIKDGTLGAVFNASYNSNDYGSDNVEFEWSNPNFIKEHDIRKYDVKRVRKSIGFNLDWKPNTRHTLELKSIFNERNDLENRYRLRYKFKKDGYVISRQTKGGINNDDNANRRLEKQTTYKIGIHGNHIILNNIATNWKVSISKAKELRPNERYITYKLKQKATDISQLFLNTETPSFVSKDNAANNTSLFELDEISEMKKYTEEQKISSKIDVLIPIKNEGFYQSNIKFGYKYKHKEKLRDNDFFEYTKQFEKAYEKMITTSVNDQTNNSFLAGKKYKAGLFVTSSFLGNLNLNQRNGVIKYDEFIPYNYNATENIYAFYAMTKQKIGTKFSFIAGLRTEKTTINYNGYEFYSEGEKNTRKTYGTKSYTNWLPNLQIKYTPINNVVTRFAFTKTIARPNYYNLVPFKNINSDDKEAAYGNPSLKAAESINIDITSAYYFSNVGIISLGGFYKNITDFIYEKEEKETSPLGDSEAYDVTRIYNGGKATIYGFEFSLERKLNFLPSFLSNLTFYGNYTYTGSSTKGIFGRTDGLALAGAVKSMLNTSLAYETKKLTVRGALNFTDDYIDEYGSKNFNDIYYDTQLFIDANASYNIYKGLRIFIEGKNLTNQPLRYYQGNKKHTKQAEYYDMNWNIGLKYNF